MHLLKSFSIYTFSSFLTQGISFLLIPFFTRYLSPTDYGILSLVATTISLISPIVVLNMDGALSIEFFKNTFNDLPSYISSCIANSFFIFIVLTLLTLPFLFFKLSFLPFPAIWLLSIPVFCFMEGIKTVNLLLFQVQKRPIKYSFYSISNTLLNILLSIFFVGLLKYNYTGRLYAQYIVAFIFFVLGIYMLKKQNLLNFKVKKHLMKDAFDYGLPLVPHALGFTIINLADRFFVSHYAGNGGVGIYSVAYTLGSIIFIISMAFNNAWVPNFLELLSENTLESKRKIVKITYIYILCLLLLTLGLVAVTPLIFKYFIGHQFIEGAKFVPWIAFSCFFFGCYLCFTNYISYLKKNKIFGYVSIINIVLNLLLNLILIKHYGIFGAALATFCSFGFFALIISFISIKIYPMPWLNFMDSRKAN